MRTLRFIALAFVALLTFAAAAEAACATTDLNSTQWFAYIKFTGGWSRCAVNIGASGSVAMGTTCSSFEDGAITNSESVTGGVLSISTACVVTGRIDTNESGRHTVVHATLDRGKTVIIGVGKDANNDSWHFSAVKK